MAKRQTKGETTMDTSSIPGLELIQVADVVAREKSIERE
jgi:N utilization substance protein A